jgi:transposase
MFKNKNHESLQSWIDDALNCKIPEMVSFAQGLKQDFKEVHNALTYPYSNGMVEGNVNRVKMIKRQMYGRANFDLLRKRVLYQF